jgi:2'-5' RNA ligase
VHDTYRADESPLGPAPPSTDHERPLRLFVALDLPPDARDLLAAIGAAADPEIWRAVKPETLHVTLAFLGSRPPGDVATIEPVIAAEDGQSAPRLAFKRVLGLPPRRARVLTVELEDRDGTLEVLQARIAHDLAAAGVYTPETRAFRPHVTVARLRPRMRAPRDAPELGPHAFAASSITLYRSQTHPTGARYQPLARASLR